MKHDKSKTLGDCNLFALLATYGKPYVETARVGGDPHGLRIGVTIEGDNDQTNIYVDGRGASFNQLLIRILNYIHRLETYKRGGVVVIWP